MAEVSVLSFELEILIKWKLGKLLEHHEWRGHPVQEAWDDDSQERPHDGWHKESLLKVPDEEWHVPDATNRLGEGKDIDIVRLHWPSTYGTDGLEESFQYTIVKRLRERVVDLDDLAEVLQVCELELNSQLESVEQMEIFQTLVPQIRETIKNVSSELLQMRNRNPKMSLEEFRVYYYPVCWSSKKRLEFFHDLSQRLSPIRDLSLWKELEIPSKKQLIFHGEWNDIIDHNFRADKGNNSPCKYCYKSVRDLVRFIRNTWSHRQELPKKYKEKYTGQDGEMHFYGYFHEKFPNLLMVSYREASKSCGLEQWFEPYKGEPLVGLRK